MRVGRVGAVTYALQRTHPYQPSSSLLYICVTRPQGGSAYLLVDRNVIHDCGTTGFGAGQSTGLQYMVPPWTHYEAYDIKFTNNVLHDVDGAAFGVWGGFNILMAHNTAYR